MKRKLRVGVTASVFLAALLFWWVWSEDSPQTRGRGDETETASFPPQTNSGSHLDGEIQHKQDGPKGLAACGVGRSAVEIPSLVALLGEDLGNRFEKGGPFEPKDLPSVGRALKRMDGVIKELWDSGDSKTNAAAQERYIQLQKKYSLIMSMVARSEKDTEAQARLERYQREREKLLEEQYGEGGASGREGRDRDLARLKRKILRGEGEVRESSPGI